MSQSCNCLGTECTCSSQKNDPGLSTLSYRASRYSQSFGRMKKLIAKTAFATVDLADPSGTTKPGAAPLAGLTTRDSSDPTIAIIDAWAVSCDVLSFYQERIINEGFLRTATERRSVLELAREIGYELAPGVAATAYVAYVVDEGPLTPRSVTVPVGSSIQSLPQKEEAPQTFEVAEEAELRVNWNKLVPQLHERQPLVSGMTEILIVGPVPMVNRGDYLVVQPEAGELEVRQVRENTFTSTTNTTLLELEPAIISMLAFVTEDSDSSLVSSAAADSGSLCNPIADFFSQFSSSFSASLDTVSAVEEALLQSTLVENSASYEELETMAIQERSEYLSPPIAPFPTVDSERSTGTSLASGVYWLRYRTSNFGHNAPLYVAPTTASTGSGSSAVRPISLTTGTYEGSNIASNNGTAWDSGADFQLERSIPDIRTGEPILLQATGSLPNPYQVLKLTESSVAAYGISGKSTGVNAVGLASNPPEFADYLLRGTTIYAGASGLSLAPLPVTSTLNSGDVSITLNCLVTGIAAGRIVSITGELSTLPGVYRSELATVKNATHYLGLTTLEFEAPLENSYIRSTLTLNANVVKTNHGSTVSGEIIGSGDASKIHQTFPLKKKPLTYVSSSDPSGSTSTLEIRVNGVLWTAIPSLYNAGPNDKVYAVRIADDGVVSVIFGDGLKGARLPTGTYNVVATYREGIGVAGLVPATTLTLPKRKPLGVRSMANPLDATGGVDPENLNDARENAPSTVLTMGRIIGRKDLEDFARAFAGVGKSSAQEVFDKQIQLLLLTVGSSEETPFDTTSEAYKNLLLAVNSSSEPDLKIRVLTYNPKTFDVTARIQIDAAYVSEDVISAAEDELIAEFSFATRKFAEPVSLAEVMSTIQRVPGVLSVDIDILRFSSDVVEAAPTLLVAQKATYGIPDSTKADLLTINTQGISLIEVTA
jgi:hypothetical protein